MTASRALARRKWFWLFLEGVIGVVAGILAIAWPGITVFVLAVLLGVGLIVQGAFDLAAGTEAMSGTPGRGWALFFGVVALVAGIIVLINPGTGVFAIIVGVTAWFFVAAVNDFVAAFAFRHGRVLHLVLGVLTAVAAFLLIAHPAAALTTAALVTGLVFLLRGAATVALSLALRRA